MNEISFYQLGRQSIERALLKLLQKTLDGGNKAVIRLASDAEVGVFDLALWTHDPDSFLPHGTAKSNFPEAQPVYLTDGEDNPAGADFLFILHGAPVGELKGYKRIFFVFNGAVEGEVKRAREHWKSFKEAGANLTYWSQGEGGGWKKKSTA